ncbi:DUF2867 domain-containing protein [Collimonas pratensis]|uniref:DUF2867 domain-containing protein n=1 Tax=Collimonas pratensis TaxID=279113 RepID=A0ABM5ZA85_9BURK|nr:DUF2867 domain-containing protein [Collimonas pratensis]AMP15880.1 hypothetical protein CPter291_3646 [Collimonas pratensis]
MPKLTQIVDTFPSVRIPSESGGLAVEVCLIAQMGHGSGSHLFASVASRQRQHGAFVDELDEPSVKLGGTNFLKGDATSLYSFVVGTGGHPFHRHAGHRVFTAVSGSGGAQLRFSSVSAEQMAEDPRNFVRALRFVNIPPDCMFTVRFGGETWHQFSPLSRKSIHPAFFALSCHTNELGGNLPDDLKQKVLANDASIPALTELLPPAIAALLAAKEFDAASIPATTLSLDAPPGTVHRLVCNTVRSSVGWLRGAWSSWKGASGFLSYEGSDRAVRELKTAPAASLLNRQLAGMPVHHEDTFSLRVTGASFKDASAAQLLASVLEGFLLNRPGGVSSLMALRNVLVKPLGLRTSPLGCPVSSLLSADSNTFFVNRYPVLDQSVDAADTRAEVILGADDKHLLFRSCVAVDIVDEHHVDITLGTRVHCKNLFGRFYMSAIAYIHRRYVAPAMLSLAVEFSLDQVEDFQMNGRLAPA